jgi:hypothetical protein
VIEFETVYYHGEPVPQFIARDTYNELQHRHYNGTLALVDFPMLLCSCAGDEWYAEQYMQVANNTNNATLPWSSLWSRPAAHESVSVSDQIKLYASACEFNRALAEELRRFIDDDN